MWKDKNAPALMLIFPEGKNIFLLYSQKKPKKPLVNNSVFSALGINKEFNFLKFLKWENPPHIYFLFKSNFTVMNYIQC